MTKLMEWLTGAVLFLSIWLSILTGNVSFALAKDHPTAVLLFPVFVIGLFGVYAASVVLYRTLTFNTCSEAAVELQREILEAKADLQTKGFMFANE